MNTTPWFTTWIQEIYLLFFFSFHCLPDIDSSQSLNEEIANIVNFLPLSFSDPRSGGGGATGRPVICNNSKTQSSLKVIHSIGRNRLPHFKIHLKHWRFEEAVHFWRTFSFQKEGFVCLNFNLCYLELGFTGEALRAISLWMEMQDEERRIKLSFLLIGSIKVHCNI